MFCPREEPVVERVHGCLQGDPHLSNMREKTRKVDARLPGKGNSNSHGARPVHLIITMIVDSDQWVVNKELSLAAPKETAI